jgi:hypothetical protein
VTDWRRLLIGAPVQIVDTAWLGYLVLLAAGALICLATAALWLLAAVLGYPLP